jgi:glycine reductase
MGAVARAAVNRVAETEGGRMPMGGTSFRDRSIVVLGERDGISGPALAAVVESMGARVIFQETACFV